MQNNYYEFIPEGEKTTPGIQTAGCHELEQGKQYKIILTNRNGLYRYDIHDVIEVQGFYHGTPVIAFVRKSNDMLNITGEKLHVNHFLTTFQNVKDQYNLSVTQFRAVPNYEKLRYEILIHVDSQPSPVFLQNTILPFIDHCLSKANIEYDGKRKSRRLNPPCIHVMDETWVDDAQKCFFESGRRDVQNKWRMLAAHISDVDAKHIICTLQM